MTVVKQEIIETLLGADFTRRTYNISHKNTRYVGQLHTHRDTLNAQMRTYTTAAANLQTEVGLLYKLYVRKCRSLFAQSNRFILYRLYCFIHSSCILSPAYMYMYVHAHTDRHTHRMLAVSSMQSRIYHATMNSLCTQNRICLQKNTQTQHSSSERNSLFNKPGDNGKWFGFGGRRRGGTIESFHRGIQLSQN